MQKHTSAQQELHLLVPGICGPLSDLQLLADKPEVKHWIKTLARAGVSKAGNNANNVIAEITGLKVENDFPAAVLTLLANDIYDESLYYMHADPVHLRADLDHAVLTPAENLAIRKHESDALLLSLNQHFAQDGLSFIALDENRWLLASKTRINLTTTPLVDAVARNINYILPQGEAAGSWHQRMTEIQMLMFSHEINTLRESSNQSMINSVWFYGSGELMPYSSEKIYRCCSDQDVLKGLAKHIGGEFLPRPATSESYMKFLLTEKNADNKKTVNILHLSELESLVNYTDVDPWLQQLTATLNNWIYPLLAFSNKNNIKLTLYPCNSKQYRFSKYDVLKFWHNYFRPGINQYIDSYASNRQQ